MSPEMDVIFFGFLRINGSDGSRGTRDARPLPRGSKFFQFHAVFGKIWQNLMLAPLPPRGNPGSGTEWSKRYK